MTGRSTRAAAPAPDREIRLDPARIVGLLAGCAAALAAASVAGQVIKATTSHGSLYGLINLVDLDREANLPTFFSTVILLATVTVVFLIARLERRAGAPYARHWDGLALLVLFMSADEAAGLHELGMRPGQELLGARATGVLHFAWVVPAAVLVAAVAAAYLRFVLRLPSRTRALVLAAGSVFVGGALGVELLEGRYVSVHGEEDLTYELIATAQETLEMAGVLLLLYAMLDYLRAHHEPVHIHLTRH